MAALAIWAAADRRRGGRRLGPRSPEIGHGHDRGWAEQPSGGAVGGPGTLGYPRGHDGGHGTLGGARSAGSTSDILALVLWLIGLVSGVVTMGGGVLHVAGMMTFRLRHLSHPPVTYLTNLFIFGGDAPQPNQPDRAKRCERSCPGPSSGGGGLLLANSASGRLALILGVFALPDVAGLYEDIRSPTKFC